MTVGGTFNIRKHAAQTSSIEPESFSKLVAGEEAAGLGSAGGADGGCFRQRQRGSKAALPAECRACLPLWQTK